VIGRAAGGDRQAHQADPRACRHDPSTRR
jgi:hypothetical protein